MKKKAFICVLVFIVFGFIFPFISKAEYLDTLWKLDLWPNYSRAAKISPDGNHVLVTQKNKIYKYDILNGSLVSTFIDSCDTVICEMSISKDLSIISVLDIIGKYIYLYDYNQETLIKRISLPPGYKYFYKVMFTNDNKYLVIAAPTYSETKFLLYDIENDSLNEFKSKPEFALMAMTLSPDGQYLVTGELDYDYYSNKYTSYLQLYSLDSLALITTFGTLNSTVQSLRYSPDGKYLACGRDNGGSLTIWDMDSLSLVKEIDIREDSTWTYQRGAFTKNNDFLVLGWPGVYHSSIIYDFKNDFVFARLPIASPWIDVYPDSNYILLNGAWLYILRLNPGTNPVTDRDGSGSEKSLTIVYRHDKISLDFELIEPDAVEINIYDSRGVPIKTISTGWLESGSHNLTQKLSLASGVYFAKFKSGSRTFSKKFEVIK